MPFYGTYNFAYLTSMEDRNDFILASSGVPSMICWGNLRSTLCGVKPDGTS